MQLFRYTEDRLPVAIFTAYFALDVILFFTVQSFWVLLLWLVLGIIPKACISAWNHHHQHVMTFKQPLLNRLLEIVYTFHTGITGNAWVLHHVVGHHLHYLDQEKDESRWKRLDGTKMGEQEYSLNVAMTAYPRAYQVGLKFKKHMKIFLWMCLLSLTLLSLAFWYNWRNALMVFLLPMLISLYLTAKTTYKHHSGLDTDDEFAASTNILNHVYNICTGNLGYHTAHHVKMGIHWSRLPEYHATIAHKIPQHCYLEPGFPWNIFPAHAPAIQPAVAPQKQPVEG
ncbi:MAG: fatty acid desaturase [Deltaproteobacteria bacterium]|nr:fatty acid desaturase [Deltaproteobacteria bacterium]MBU52435.1 fatty acid desaturase [Deltaproteobacteria bacterium]|tara:strand:+ start:19994 stop:20845 length:852 start_codon:yes stop_codon:yes gene_type:complete